MRNGGVLLPNIIQNPFFQVIILFLIASFFWYMTTDYNVVLKKKAFSLVTDGVFYFIFITLGLNALLNLSGIIEEPYGVILFSSNVSWLGTVIAVTYLMFQYRKEIASDTEMINIIIGYFLFLGFFNHFFYYFKYRNLMSVLFIVIYFVLYLLHDKIKSIWKNEFLLLVMTVLHAVIMYFYSSVIIYYQIVFYPYQITSLFIWITLLLYWFRRKISSKQK